MWAEFENIYSDNYIIIPTYVLIGQTARHPRSLSGGDDQDDGFRVVIIQFIYRGIHQKRLLPFYLFNTAVI